MDNKLEKQCTVVDVDVIIEPSSQRQGQGAVTEGNIQCTHVSK